MSRVKSFYVGDGDMFYIYHNSDNFTIIDCCYSDEDDKYKNFHELKRLHDDKNIIRFISTHPDDDHIRGIEDLDELIHIRNFYVVKNQAIKLDEETDSFNKYCELRDDQEKAFYIYKGCKRRWMNESDENRSGSGIQILWPDRDNEDFKEALKKVKEGTGFNNISPIITYSTGGATFMWMGDMENDFQKKIADCVSWPKVDILFAPHHGRESGKVPTEILDEIDPRIIVIGSAPSKYLDYYSGYDTIKQNSAKDIVFDCVDSKINIYVSNEDYPYSIDSLSYSTKAAQQGLGCYLGSIIL